MLVAAVQSESTAAVAAIRTEYEKMLNTETAAIKEHYLIELQAHLQVRVQANFNPFPHCLGCTGGATGPPTGL